MGNVYSFLRMASQVLDKINDDSLYAAFLWLEMCDLCEIAIGYNPDAHCMYWRAVRKQEENLWKLLNYMNGGLEFSRIIV